MTVNGTSNLFSSHRKHLSINTVHARANCKTRMMLGARLAIIIAAIVTYAAPALGSGHGHGHHKRRTGTLLNRMRHLTNIQRNAAEKHKDKEVQAALNAVTADKTSLPSSPALHIATARK